MDIYSLPSGAEVLVDFNPYYGLSSTVADELDINTAFKSIGAVKVVDRAEDEHILMDYVNTVRQLCLCSQLYCDTDTAG